MYLKEELQHLVRSWEDGLHEAEERTIRAFLDEWALERTEANIHRARQEYAALSVMEHIPERARNAAKLGRRSLAVYEFGEEAFERPSVTCCDTDDTHCEPRWLTGMARHIFERCAGKDLSPKLAYYRELDDGKGRWQIVICW